MRIVPRQLEFDNAIPTVSGNADYAAEKELLLEMDAIISQSGIEEIVITPSWRSLFSTKRLVCLRRINPWCSG